MLMEKNIFPKNLSQIVLAWLSIFVCAAFYFPVWTGTSFKVVTFYMKCRKFNLTTILICLNIAFLDNKFYLSIYIYIYICRKIDNKVIQVEGEFTEKSTL